MNAFYCSQDTPNTELLVLSKNLEIANTANTREKPTHLQKIAMNSEDITSSLNKATIQNNSSFTPSSLRDLDGTGKTLSQELKIFHLALMASRCCSGSIQVRIPVSSINRAVNSISVARNCEPRLPILSTEKKHDPCFRLRIQSSFS